MMEKAKNINSGILNPKLTKQRSEVSWVRETRFGRWFLSTDTWYKRVLSIAVADLTDLLDKKPEVQQILDAGCGSGPAFSLLEQHFHPKTIIGVDVDKVQLGLATEAAKKCHCEVKIEHKSIYDLNIPDNSIDMILCHQLLHHVCEQEQTLKEFYRILSPGGIVLISESCRTFIYSFPVRLLFRHPMNVQKTAEEYIELVKSAGFKVADNESKAYSPWWSHKDLGLSAILGLSPEPKEATEIIMIARKP